MSEDNQPYRDFSDAIDAGDGGMASPSPHQPADHNFPVKLHYVLSELEKDGLQDVASWAPHGRCFKVHQTEEFVESVLRRWFRQSQIASFQRQLNIYGFTRITFGPDKNSYYHEHFLRGMLFLSRRIQRTTVKGQGPRRPSCYQSQPNFYSMPFLPPEPSSSSATTGANASASLAARAQEPNASLAARSGGGLTAPYPALAEHAAAAASMPPQISSNPSLRELIQLQDLLNHRDGAARPLAMLPQSSRSSLLDEIASLSSLGANPGAGLLEHRQYAAPVAASVPSSLQMLLQPPPPPQTAASASASSANNGDLARAMVLQSIAASRRRYEEATLVQDHVRAQIMANATAGSSALASQASGQEQQSEEDNQRRLLLLAYLNGTL